MGPSIVFFEFMDRSAWTVFGWEIRKCMRSGSVGTVSGRLLRCSSSRIGLDGLEVDPPLRLEVSRAYYPMSGRLMPLEVRREGFYVRLHAPLPGAAPTILLNGIVMHRITGVDPLSDARAKVRAAGVRKGSRVLDVCTGLGYTAIEEARAGASEVYTIEVSEEVLALAELNPFSRGLTDDKIRLVLGDASSVLEAFPDSYFDVIVHDPPRFHVAGELYSLEFYKLLYRLLRPGGRLFHYTGEPMRRRGRGHGPLVRGVIERLRAAGFRVLGYRRGAQGVAAVKPKRLL